MIHRRWAETENITIDALKQIFDGYLKLIVKPLNGTQGSGIYTIDIRTTEDIIALYEKTRGKYIIEEIIVQHPKMADLNGTSINTVRVYSVCIKNEIDITGATLRIGRNGKLTDNYSAGGIAAEIDVESGLVVSKGITQDGSSFLFHPDTKFPIIGFQIPAWDEIIKNVKKAHSFIPQLGYIAWDVVICSDMSIEFIEGNTFGGVALQQHPSRTGKKQVYEKYLKYIKESKGIKK